MTLMNECIVGFGVTCDTHGSDGTLGLIIAKFTPKSYFLQKNYTFINVMASPCTCLFTKNVFEDLQLPTIGLNAKSGTNKV